MSKEFYEAMKIRVQAGQFRMEDMLKDLDKALGKGLINMEQYDELKAMAFETCDPGYEGNHTATAYDESQDIDIAGNTMATLENFELIMMLEEMIAGLMELNEEVSPAMRAMYAMARSAIGDNYVKMILAGNRTFDQVPSSKKEEVAEKLITMGREDLITDPAYKPSLPEIPEYVPPLDGSGEDNFGVTPLIAVDGVEAVVDGTTVSITANIYNHVEGTATIVLDGTNGMSMLTGIEVAEEKVNHVIDNVAVGTYTAKVSIDEAEATSAEFEVIQQ